MNKSELLKLAEELEALSDKDHSNIDMSKIYERLKKEAEVSVSDKDISDYIISMIGALEGKNK